MIKKRVYEIELHKLDVELIGRYFTVGSISINQEDDNRNDGWQKGEGDDKFLGVNRLALIDLGQDNS